MSDEEYDGDDKNDDDISYDDNNNYDNEFEEEELKEEGEEEIDILDEEGKQNKKNSKEIDKEKRITTEYLTKYEKARVLGARALQISKNAPVMINLEPGEWNPLSIAEKELKDGKIPFIIRRYLPNNTYEDWKVNELKLD